MKTNTFVDGREKVGEGRESCAWLQSQLRARKMSLVTAPGWLGAAWAAISHSSRQGRVKPSHGEVTAWKFGCAWTGKVTPGSWGSRGALGARPEPGLRLMMPK